MDFNRKLASGIGLAAAAVVAALSLGAIAVAQVGSFSDSDTEFSYGAHGAPGPLDADYGCDGPTNQIIEAGDLGWVEVALRSRGLVLVDHGAPSDVAMVIESDTPEEIRVVFDDGSEVTVLSVTHVKGTIVSARHTRSVTATTGTGSQSDPPPSGSADEAPSPSDGEQAGPDAGAKADAKDGGSRHQPWLRIEFDLELEATAA